MGRAAASTMASPRAFRHFLHSRTEMPPRQTDEEQADFVRALEAVAQQGPLPQAQLDALSMLEGGDLTRFQAVFAELPAAARARLVKGLSGAAEQRLRLDYSAVNRLALNDADATVRLEAVKAALEDRSPALLNRLLELVKSDPSVDVRHAAAEDLARFTVLAELDNLDQDSTGRLRTTLFDVVS